MITGEVCERPFVAYIVVGYLQYQHSSRGRVSTTWLRVSTYAGVLNMDVKVDVGAGGVKPDV